MSKTRGRRVLEALALGVAGLTLTGCAGLHPGVAVEVGEESISVEKVDRIATDFCEAVEPQLDGQAESVQNSYFRGGIAGTLAMRSIADQIAVEYDVAADSQEYLDQLTEIRRGASTLPEDLQESVVEVDSAPLYVQEIQTQIGKQVLDGETDPQALLDAGAERFGVWAEENGVEFDPSLNTTMEGGTIANQDRALSFAVSEAATSGLEEQPNSVRARQTPDSHRCGR